MNVVSLWSGGKDSCLACYKARQSGYKVTFLLNLADSGGEKSLSHGLPDRIIQEQAAMAAMPLLQKAMSKANYEDSFKALISELKEKKGIGGIVFGDIYLQEHKDWIDKVCEETGTEAVMPLWGKDTPTLANDFIKEGFKAIIVSTREEFLGREWLGREIDNELINDLKKLGNIDLCGEKGEFHTFVYDGPIFKEPVKFIYGNRVLKGKHWFLELLPQERRG